MQQLGSCEQLLYMYNGAGATALYYTNTYKGELKTVLELR